MNESTMSEYIKGFDHGCDYIVAEIERYTKEANSHDAMVLVDLVKRLKMEENTKNIAAIPSLKGQEKVL